MAGSVFSNVNSVMIFGGVLVLTGRLSSDILVASAGVTSNPRKNNCSKAAWQVG
jgi:hypothetical protein